MTAEEKTRFDSMEKSVTQIENDIAEIKSALLGNKISGEKGFRGQIDTLKAEVDILKSEIKTLREQRAENGVYVLIIKGLLMLLSGAVIGYFINKK